MKPQVVFKTENSVVVLITNEHDGIPGKCIYLMYDRITKQATVRVEYHGDVLHVDHLPLKSLEQAITFVRQS